MLNCLVKIRGVGTELLEGETHPVGLLQISPVYMGLVKSTYYHACTACTAVYTEADYQLHH